MFVNIEIYNLENAESTFCILTLILTSMINVKITSRIWPFEKLNRTKKYFWAKKKEKQRKKKIEIEYIELQV